MHDTTQAQDQAIQETKEGAASNGATLYEVEGMKSINGGQLEVVFRYSTPEVDAGREMAIFAADGSVVSANDFGGGF
jgi:hypothetical protein